MSTAIIGALIGLALAGAEFWLLRKLASRVDLPETKRVLNVTGWSQMVLFPIIGWFAAPFITGE